MLLLHN